MNSEGVAVGDWGGLFQQLVANMRLNAMPKKPKAEDWFMLRDRWNRYPESQRKYYLAAALGRYIFKQQECGEKIDVEVVKRFSFGAGCPFEYFTNTEKGTIAMAIMDAERYSKVDNALISKKRALKKRLNQPDEWEPINES